eukprot:236578-Chlamydomonas_euryale.AAC.2
MKPPCPASAATNGSTHPHTCHTQVRHVWTDHLVEQYLQLSHEQYTRRWRACAAAAESAQRTMHAMVEDIVAIAGGGAAAVATAGPGAAADAAARALRARADEMSARLVAAYDARAKALVEQARLEEVAGRFVRAAGGFSERRARDALELSLVDNAEL